MPSVCALVLTVCLCAIAQNPQQPKSAPCAQQQPIGDGRQIFESSCSACHGLDGRGGERAPDISTRPQVMQLSDDEILTILRAGRPAAGMPPFDSLGRSKLKALVAYLRALQGKDTASALPGDPVKGKLFFFGKARCSECHMVQGEGGFIGRDLSSYGAALSPAEIRANLLRPGDNTNLANKTVVVTMCDSRKFTGVIRNEDNFSIQLQFFDGTFHFLTRSDVAQIEFLPEPIMPTDYGTTLKPAELDDLVSYLMAASNATKNDKKTDSEDDNE